jgi:hypothetical protein
VNPIDRLLESVWAEHGDTDAKRNLKSLRTELEDVQHYIVRLDTIIAAMLKDKRVNIKWLDEQEQANGLYLYQCINAAAADLQAAHTRLLTYYEALRPPGPFSTGEDRSGGQ